MSYLSEMFEAYLECALWSTTDNSREDGGDPLENNYGPEDIESETYANMLEDCASFLSNVEEILDDPNLPYGNSPDRVGHDFWLTRNGHGTGFWDRGLGEAGDRLSGIAKTYGTYDLIVTDEGKVAN